MNDKINVMNSDGLLHIELLEGQARALLVDSTHLVEQARSTHGLSRTACAALGRHLTATAMLGAMLKGEKDSVTATIKGGGPLGTVVAVGRADGSVKGYVDHPEADPPRRADKKLNVGAAVGKEGKLTVVKDLGLRDPYVGQVNLVSGEIAEDFAFYFTVSEQTPSLVSLGVMVEDKVLAAGGLLIQPMPGCSEIALRSLETSAPMFMNISATILEYGLKDSVFQLLGHLQPRVLETAQPVYRCDCSRARMEKVLISLGEEELEDMIRTQHGAEIHCQFCNRFHRFSEEDLRVLLQQAR